MSSLIIEPMYRKDYLRMLTDNYYKITPPSDNILNFPGDRHFAIQCVFRTIASSGSGDWDSLFEKIGTGLGPGGANVGYEFQMNKFTGQLRVLIRYDISGAPETDIFTNGSNFNDGRVWNAIFTFNRSTGAYAWYVGTPLNVDLDNEGIDTDYLSDTFENDGDFTVTSARAGFRTQSDIFLIRIFSGLDLDDSDIIAALDSDLTRPIDTFGIPELVYTDDPVATPGCVAEWFRERQPTDGSYYWQFLNDTSGNDLHLSSNGSDSLYSCWGDHLLPKDKGELDVSFWDTASKLPKVSAIVPKAKRQGGIETTFSTIKQRTLSLKGHFYDVTRAQFESIRNPVVKLLNQSFNSLRDPNLADEPYGFILFDSIDSINDNFEFIPRPNRMSRMQFNLLCGDPGWHMEYHQSDPVTIDASSGWEGFIDLDYQGNLESFPRIMLFGMGAGGYMGPVYIENLSTGKSLYIGLYDDTGEIWFNSLGTASTVGKCLQVLGDSGRVYWNDFETSKIEYFSGEFFELVPGNNHIRIFVDDILGNSDLLVIFDYWEKNI